MGRILSQHEVVQLIAQYQARVLNLVPKAIAAYEEVLDSDNLHLKAAIATKLLEGLHVLHKGGIEQTVEIANRASPGNGAEGSGMPRSRPVDADGH